MFGKKGFAIIIPKPQIEQMMTIKTAMRIKFLRLAWFGLRYLLVMRISSPLVIIM
jgi:hypothetical protein